MSVDILRQEYADVVTRANRLEACLREQVGSLLTKHDITLGVPLESRVKTWQSIEEKIDRKSLKLESLQQLDDIVGIRTILLFSRDADKLAEILAKELNVQSFENTASRLDEAQFGYQSIHYVVRLPLTWLQIPSYEGLGMLKAEVQIRTVAQHIWAAASHKLQYKREESVPPQLRRNINRVSALLETVDLEFDRVLSEREEYVEKIGKKDAPDEVLNVDILSKMAEDFLPKKHQTGAEDFDKLLSDLNHFNINKRSELRDLLDRHLDAALKYNDELVIKNRDSKYANKDRLAQGVFLTQAGLIRSVMREEFGSEKVRPVFTSGRARLT